MPCAALLLALRWYNIFAAHAMLLMPAMPRHAYTLERCFVLRCCAMPTGKPLRDAAEPLPLSASARR